MSSTHTARKMSHGRRTSQEKRSHGYPIQIYFEAVNVGKSLGGTKKRIKWRFGWTESPEEQEIEVIHSLVSGKKTILEDGQEVHSAVSVTATNFNHAWHSHGLYVFRVEIITSMLEDAVYLFTIDGVRFQDWQRKGMPRKIVESRNAGRYNDESDDYVEHRGTTRGTGGYGNGRENTGGRGGGRDVGANRERQRERPAPSQQ